MVTVAEPPLVNVSIATPVPDAETAPLILSVISPAPSACALKAKLLDVAFAETAPEVVIVISPDPLLIAKIAFSSPVTALVVSDISVPFV